MKLFYFDLETTGVLVNRNGIHQISAIIEIDGEVKERLDLRVQPNPRAKIEEEALKVAGVTKEQILAYPPMDVIYKQLIVILNKYIDKYNKKDKFTLIGYNNASFDNGFLRAWFKQNGDNYFGSYFWANSLDAMVLASYYLKERRSELINFKQSTVAEFLGINVEEDKLHDALYDVEICRAIYQTIDNNLNK